LKTILLSLPYAAVGMMSAVFNFMWALPGLISTYATSTASALFFYAVASLSAGSVALSLLLLLYGTAGSVGTFHDVILQ
jgi:uncharacterized membrane protein